MEPYCDAYVQAAREAVADETSMRYRFVQESDPLRWLATLDALQTRLAAAEAAVAEVKSERNEWKDIASVFLAATEPDQPVPVMGKIMLAQVRGRAREAFDTMLRGNASAKEGM